jgi:predicted dehydrogenase
MNNANTPSAPPTRRRFLQTSGAALVSGVLAGPLYTASRAWAAEADVLRLGLIGCGGRGTGAVAQALAADPRVVVTALGDAFQDRLGKSLQGLKQSSPSRIQVDPDRCFIGFDAYQKVIDSGVDVVILASPPGFRPVHLKAAVEAGKHIFCEKPVAVDALGVRSVLASAELARQKRLALVSGFCWRYNPAERATFQQIHEGAIGEIRSAYATYNTGSLWVYPRQPDWSDMVWQMRNWYYFTWLSGDHLVEQAVHSVDKMAWAMKDEMPVKAVAHGGRQVRTAPEFGHIYDHFSVVYEYANGVRGFLFCRQQDNCSNDTSDYICGVKGACVINGARPLHQITGETNWNYTGPRKNMYQVEHDELFASIRSGKPINDGVRMAQSTMMAILGRMAAYTGKMITWEEALKSTEDLTPGRLAWDAPLSVPPVPIPGKTPFL